MKKLLSLLSLAVLLCTLCIGLYAAVCRDSGGAVSCGSSCSFAEGHCACAGQCSKAELEVIAN